MSKKKRKDEGLDLETRDECDQEEVARIRRLVVEDLWPDDLNCTPSRLAGRRAARANKDCVEDRPKIQIQEWLLGFIDVTHDMDRFNRMRIR